MSRIDTGWYKIYRPEKIEDYVFQNDFEEERVREYIKNQDIPDLLFSGHRGLGKTTLGLILKNELNVEDVDFLWLNASDENSVDTIRRTIKPFISTMSMGKFKIVFMDEGDSLTPQAQAALKSMMEDESRNARFIITCNNPEKLLPEIRSRCTEYKFSGLNADSMKEIGLKILMDRGLDIKHANVNELKANLQAHLDISYPDFRRFITSLEQHYIGGKLVEPSMNDKDLEIMVELLMAVESGNWIACRNLIFERLPTDEIKTAYSFLDQNLSWEPDKMRKAYVILANYAYRNETIALPELNLVACTIKLCELVED